MGLRKVFDLAVEGPVGAWAKSVLQSVRELQAHPFADGHVVKGLFEGASGQITVEHKLGRVPQGWFPVAKNADSSIWEYQARDKRYLYLETSTNITVDIFVY